MFLSSVWILPVVIQTLLSKWWLFVALLHFILFTNSMPLGYNNFAVSFERCLNTRCSISDAFSSLMTVFSTISWCFLDKLHAPWVTKFCRCALDSVWILSVVVKTLLSHYSYVKHHFVPLCGQITCILCIPLLPLCFTWQFLHILYIKYCIQHHFVVCLQQIRYPLSTKFLPLCFGQCINTPFSTADTP